MAEITAALVMELRATTGAGMMDCKHALRETAGDVDAAVAWLRKKGLAAAAKKAGRVASEGLVGIAVDGNAGAVVEVNAETDFVARNETFQDFVKAVAGLALHTGGDLEALKGAAYPETGKTVEEQLTSLVATIGENLRIRRAAVLTVESGVLASYMHNALAPGLGKIGVLVAVEGPGGGTNLETLGKQLAMHVAATSPQAVSRQDMDPAAVERERDILREQARATGKPDDIVEKMAEGRLRKYYEEVCLLDQTYVIDGKSKVGKVLEAAAGDAGGAVAVNGFVRYLLGEGIEKRTGDLAADVVAALGG